MNTESIKQFAERQLERMEQVVGFDRSPAWYEDAMRLRELWVQASQAESLARIATQLEGQVALLQGDDIVEKLSRIGSIIENATDK